MKRREFSRSRFWEVRSLDYVGQFGAAEDESQIQILHTRGIQMNQMCGGQEDPQQHIHQVCILEQDMSEVICHENSAMYFSVPDHTKDWTGKKNEHCNSDDVKLLYIDRFGGWTPDSQTAVSLQNEMVCRWGLFVLALH